MIRGRVHAASLARISRKLDQLPDRVYRVMRPEFQRWGSEWQDRVTSRFVAGGDSNLHNRTGFLRGTVKARVGGDGASSLKLRNTSGGAIYATIQERGGVIRPVNGRFLMIPTAANLTPAGVARYPSARAFIQSHPGQTFWLRTAKGELLLMWRQPSNAARLSVKAKRGEAVAMWRGVRQSEIPGPDAPNKRRASRFGFFDSWRELAPDRRAGLQKVARQLRSDG